MIKKQMSERKHTKLNYELSVNRHLKGRKITEIIDMSQITSIIGSECQF